MPSSVPTPILPSQRVASFQNQQIGQLNAGLGLSALSPTQQALSNAAGNKQSAVQLSAQKRMDSIKGSNARLKQIADTYAARNRSTYSQDGVQTSGQKSMIGGGGRAWQNNGHLSRNRNKVLQMASSYLGTRYVLGGTSRRGIDCSGLVMMIYNQFGYKLNHSAGQQGRNIPGVRTSIRNLRPGDLVAWKDGSHIAIYAGNGEIIEAANPRVGTVRRRLWSNAVYGIALRLPGE